jgi:hypothetical protein
LRPLVWQASPDSAKKLWRTAQALRRGRSPRWFGPKLRQFSRTQTFGHSELRSERRGVVDIAMAEHLVTLRDAREQVEIQSECRHEEPFLSEELLAFVASIPPAFFFFGNIRRGLFREAMRGVIPESIRLREDKASASPAIAAMFSPAGLAHLRPWLSMSASSEQGFVDAAAFDQSMEEAARSGTGGPWLRLWPAIALEALLRGHATPAKRHEAAA